jgi:hypothetical protein
MKKIHILLFFFISVQLFAQDKSNSNLKLYSSLQKDSLLAKFDSTYVLKKFRDTVNFYRMMNEILDCYKLEIANSECGMQTQIRYERYYFNIVLIEQFGKILNDSIWSLYEQDLKYLKSKGLKPDRDGLGLGVYFIKGKDYWLGFDFSFHSFFSHEKEFRSKCDGKIFTYSPNKFTTAYNAITISYSRAFAGMNNFSFSPIDLYAPFVFVPLKFGFQFDNKFNDINYYYRPALGFSILGIFSISYSYNFMFSKKVRATSEKNIFYFKLAYPITNPKYKKR